MGGEANKFLTFLHTTGQSFEGAMKNVQKYNLLTQQGVDGAMKANAAVGNLWGVAITGMEDVVGRITGDMAPMVNDAARRLADWVREEEPKIVTAWDNWLKPDKSGETGPERLWDNAVRFGKAVGYLADEVVTVAERLGFVLPDSGSGASGQAGIDREKAHAKALSNATNDGMMQADKTPGIDKGWKFWTSGERLDFVKAYAAEHAPEYETIYGITDTQSEQPSVSLSRNAHPSITTTNHNNITLNVTIAGGTPTNIAQDLHDEVKRIFGEEGFSPTVDQY